MPGSGERENLLRDEVAGGVAHVRLGKDGRTTVLTSDLRSQIAEVIPRLDADPDVRCIVISGNDRGFVAGSDIRAMRDSDIVQMLHLEHLELWHRLRRLRTPLVAAVTGYALGSGCELALVCDMIIAGESAVFAQPEIGLGIMAGGGGTQRLMRSAGKAKALEWLLTGRRFSADEAERAGVVTRCVPDAEVVEEALRLAADIASKPPLAVRLTKEAALLAYDTSLERGLDHERRNFELLFATEDAHEGLSAFLEKRPPAFKGR